MKLFWCPKTRASRALWMLEEVGVAYERIHIALREPERPRDPEFALASPMGKVPALADGEARFADSAAICLYLADRYAAGRLAPKTDDPKRGRFLYWMFYSPGVIEPAMMEKFTNQKVDRRSSGWGDFPTMVATLENGLAAGPWIMGETFSAADVMLGSSVHFMKMFKILPESATLDAYIARCLARPAFQRALATDEAG